MGPSLGPCFPFLLQGVFSCNWLNWQFGFFLRLCMFFALSVHAVSVSLTLQQGKIKYFSICMISFCCSFSIWIYYQWNKRGGYQGLSSKKSLVNNDSWWFAIGLKKVLVEKSCPTLCDLIDYSPQGSSVQGILQARILEWVAVHDPRIKPMSPALQEDFLPCELPGKPRHGSKQYHFSSKPWFR